MEKLDQRINYAKHSAEDIDRKLTSTDNYIEKYLPIKIHKFIISSLRNVFDNKKDLKKLKDYEAKRDWLLNEAIQNDNGLPGDFKKDVPNDVNYKTDQNKGSRKRGKEKRSNAPRGSKVDDTPSSIGASSFVVSPTKTKAKKSKRKVSKSNISNRSSQISVSRAGDDKDEPILKVNKPAQSYQKSMHADDGEDYASQSRSRAPPSIEAKESLGHRTSTLVARDEKSIKDIDKKEGSIKQVPSMRHDKSVHLVNESRLDEDQSESNSNHLKINSDYTTIKITKNRNGDGIPEESPKKVSEDSLTAEDIPETPLPDVSASFNPNDQDSSSSSDSRYPYIVYLHSHHEKEQSESEEFGGLYGRRGSKTDLIAMHELDDEFTLFLEGIPTFPYLFRDG